MISEDLGSLSKKRRRSDDLPNAFVSLGDKLDGAKKVLLFSLCHSVNVFLNVNAQLQPAIKCLITFSTLQKFHHHQHLEVHLSPLYNL